MHIYCSSFAQLFSELISAVLAGIFFWLVLVSHMDHGSTIRHQALLCTWQGESISTSIHNLLHNNYQCRGCVGLQAEALRAAAVRHLAALDAWLQTSQESRICSCCFLNLQKVLAVLCRVAHLCTVTWEQSGVLQLQLWALGQIFRER